MRQTADARMSYSQKLLGWVERAGNKVPHPAVLFLSLIVIVILLSHLLHLMGTSVTYERIHPLTHELEAASTGVNSLLAADGIRFIFVSIVPNFINFGPVGIILVAMIGVGLAERSGLIQALIRKIVIIAPPGALTTIVVALGVVSSISSGAGYLVLIPLGAAAFHSVGRNPLAGLTAAFAGVAVGYSVNFLVKPADGILAEMTNDALRMANPVRSIDATANFYFGIASSVMLIIVITLVNSRLVEPRLGAYQGSVLAAPSAGLSAGESKGLRYALLALIGFVVLILLLTVPAGGALRNPETGSLLGDSPLMDSLVFLLMLMFVATGLAYGIGANTIRRSQDAIDAIVNTLASLGPLLLLFLVISQFVAYFNYSNIGTILAVKLAYQLKDSDLSGTALLLAFLVVGALLSIPVPNTLPKWAMLAPVFVPLFLKLDVSPEAVLAAFRVSGSPPKVINPLLPQFALVVGFAQRWQKDVGVGTVVAIMMPYAATTLVAWTLLFFAWYWLGLPFGPG